jgi:hypothetical protein
MSLSRSSPRHAPKEAKVFWFFFSKKNIFLVQDFHERAGQLCRWKFSAKALLF